MKKSELPKLIFIILTFLVCGYFIFNQLSSGSSKSSSTTNSSNSKYDVSKSDISIDNETLSKIKELKDYGGTDLSDIGRANPFASVN